ncbi:hypothetical protein F511_05276 [Dorcoceras hygrometricum]|uniref:Uncharacterized protein n=1 Tax=Dorcoceras hygrometricum TaxID=472368 RepID=A0A2Z7ASZ0_9LAMI|nr:hypothetical protein F511_05276 [Dorcoceras hygrometricum]
MRAGRAWWPAMTSCRCAQMRPQHRASRATNQRAGRTWLRDEEGTAAGQWRPALRKRCAGDAPLSERWSRLVAAAPRRLLGAVARWWPTDVRHAMAMERRACRGRVRGLAPRA